MSSENPLNRKHQKTKAKFMVVGSSIKILRKNKKLTQKQLADLIGVSRQALCMWEADKRGLKAPVLRKISQIFKVPIDDLLNPNKLLNDRKEGDKTMKRTQSPAARKKEKINKIKFQLEAPQASRVVLTGDFTNWSNDGIKMRKSKKGVWSTSLDVKPGRYEYKFIVDDQWWTDPSNERTVQNALGTINSVKEVMV